MRYEVITKTLGLRSVYRSETKAIEHAQRITAQGDPHVALVIEKLRRHSIALGSVVVQDGVPVRSSSLVTPSKRMIDSVYAELTAE